MVWFARLSFSRRAFFESWTSRMIDPIQMFDTLVLDHHHLVISPFHNLKYTQEVMRIRKNIPHAGGRDGRHGDLAWISSSNPLETSSLLFSTK